MSDKQRTIKKKASISGVGLHTGKKTTLTFLPAAENHGYKFQRVDLPEQPIIDADVDNVVDTSRGTTLEQNGARVHTTEHVLAALVACEIDNVLIQMDGPEMPIMDGSAMPFVTLLDEVGAEEQQAERTYFELQENLTFEDLEKNVEMLAVPQETYRITVMVDYNSEVLGTQHAHIYRTEDIKNDIAMCRTFVFLHELEALLANNLIKGGDLDNAIVLVDREISEEKLNHLKKVFHKENVEVKGRGVLNNTKLHFFNEPARHKLLDIIGDLALVGTPLKMHVLAARPGHAGNVAFAKKIKELVKAKSKNKDVVSFDLNKEPALNINDIRKLLPHRQPFLLIDKIMEYTSESIIGVKNVTMNEEFFRGHFPEEPVMPGVLLVEAMAQTGGVLALKTVPDPECYSTYFMKIDGVKFKQKVIPGDTVVFSLKLLTPIRRGIVHMKGYAYVNNKVVLEAEMMAQIVKTKKMSSHSYIHPDAKIGKNVTIEPFATIYENVEIGDGTWIGPNSTIFPGARIGKNCRIFPGAVISAIPQDLKFNGEDTTTEIGDNTTIRECVTINRGTTDKMKTAVGSNCLLMAYVHIAHDCIVGNNVIIANSVNIAGHVEIQDWVILEGLAAVQQFVRIGAHAFITGGSLVRKDVPPFTKAAREPLQYVGINSVGLRRRGFSNDSVLAIEDIYRTLYIRGHNVTNAISIIEQEAPVSQEKDLILNFIRDAKDGIMRGIN